jgi:hypothetical protein
LNSFVTLGKKQINIRLGAFDVELFDGQTKFSGADG